MQGINSSPDRSKDAWEALLEKKNDSGDTPLMEAALEDKADVVSSLLGAGAKCEPECLIKLMEKGLEHTDSYRIILNNLSSSHQEFGGGSPKVVYPEKSFVQTFLKSNTDGQSHILKAALMDDMKTICLLIDQGVKFSVEDLKQLEEKNLQHTESYQFLLSIYHSAEEQNLEVCSMSSEEPSWSQIFKAIEEKDISVSIPPNYFKDTEFCLSVLARNGEYIQYIEEDLVTDLIASFALCQNGLALKYIPERFKENKELLSIAVKETEAAYALFTEKHQEDPDLALIFTEHNASNLEKLPSSLKESKSFVLDAIERNDAVVKYTPFKEDFEFMVEACKKNTDARLHAPQFKERLKPLIKQLEGEEKEEKINTPDWNINDSLFLERNEEGEEFITKLKEGDYPFKELKQYFLQKKASLEESLTLDFMTFEEVEASIQAISLPYILCFWGDIEAIPQEQSAALFRNRGVLNQLYLSSDLLSVLSSDSIEIISKKFPNIKTLFIEGSYIEELRGFSEESFPSLKKVVILYTAWAPSGVKKWLKEKQITDLMFTLHRPSSPLYEEELCELSD